MWDTGFMHGAIEFWVEIQELLENHIIMSLLYRTSYPEPDIDFLYDLELGIV